MHVKARYVLTLLAGAPCLHVNRVLHFINNYFQFIHLAPTNSSHSGISFHLLTDSNRPKSSDSVSIASISPSISNGREFEGRLELPVAILKSMTLCGWHLCWVIWRVSWSKFNSWTFKYAYRLHQAWRKRIKSYERSLFHEWNWQDL